MAKYIGHGDAETLRKTGEGMGQVAEWLKKIIAVVILAGFLEMLLPNNELKNITKMVMGLLIMAILIQPLIQVFDLHQRIDLVLPSSSGPESNPATRQIIQRGLTMRKSWTGEFKKRNKVILEGKLRNIIGLIDEVHLEELTLGFQEDQLVRTILKLRLLKPEPVNGAAFKRIRGKIIDSVQLLTNLPEEQIEVIWDG